LRLDRRSRTTDKQDKQPNNNKQQQLKIEDNNDKYRKGAMKHTVVNPEEGNSNFDLGIVTRCNSEQWQQIVHEATQISHFTRTERRRRIDSYS
jgi:hypothetical protein